jgi:hypothetical protein
MQGVNLVLAFAVSAFLAGPFVDLDQRPAPKTVPPKVSAQAKRDSENMSKKLAQMVMHLEPVSGKPKPAALRTNFTDTELNAWLANDGKDQLTPGLVNPRVTFTEPRKLSTKVLVDLDAVRKSKERGMFDMANLLTGVVEVTLNGTLTGSGGMGVFGVESAYLGALPIPRALLQELIAFYSKSPSMPEGVTLDKPFPLPIGIREVSIQRGSATVLQ